MCRSFGTLPITLRMTFAKKRPATNIRKWPKPCFACSRMLKAGRKTVVKDGRRLQGMAFLVSIDDESETFDSEFERLVHGIYDWYEEYAAKCGELCLGFVAPENEHENIIAYCLALIENAESLLP